MQFDDPKTGELIIENLCGGLRNYGYRVLSKPVPGGEVEYADQLRDALKTVDWHADHYRKVYRLRGYSKRLLAIVHERCPEPGWGVQAP